MRTRRIVPIVAATTVAALMLAGTLVRVVAPGGARDPVAAEDAAAGTHRYLVHVAGMT